MKALLDDHKPIFDDVNKRAQDLIGEGLGFDSAMVKQISDTDKEWNDVNDAAANQVKELEKALEQLEELDKAVKEVDEAITAEEAKVNELPPVAADVDTIKEQIEQVKVSLLKFVALKGILHDTKVLRNLTRSHVNFVRAICDWLSKTKIISVSITNAVRKLHQPTRRNRFATGITLKKKPSSPLAGLPA